MCLKLSTLITAPLQPRENTETQEEEALNKLSMSSEGVALVKTAERSKTRVQ